MSARPVLYSFRRCPYAMRARMGLLEAGVEVELREVVLRNKPDEMLRASPKATVPVLVLPDGQVVDESLDIMDWALEIGERGGLLGAQSAAQRTLIAQLDEAFKPHLDRYKYTNRYVDEAEADHRAIALDWLCAYLAPRLAIHENLFGDGVSLADLASFPFVRQFAHVDRDWFYATAPKVLCNWLLRHIESERFAAIMQKFKPWRSGEDGVIFPVA